jgi:hypothetical protein
MRVPSGRMTALPVSLELDAVVTHRRRFIPIDRWARMATEAFDRLERDAAESGRMLVLNVHPFVMGQPFRIGHLDRVLAHIVERPTVWAATGREIVDWYEQQISTTEAA